MKLFEHFSSLSDLAKIKLKAMQEHRNLPIRSILKNKCLYDDNPTPIECDRGPGHLIFYVVLLFLLTFFNRTLNIDHATAVTL